MNEIKLQVYSEIYCLLNYFPETYINKLPEKLLNLIKQNSDSKYFIEIDTAKSLEEQKIIEETKNTLVVLKYNYWSDDTEKINIMEKLTENERKYQEKLREKYNPDTLFKNKEIKTETLETSVAIVEYKESIFTKIKNWFKKHLF